MSANIPTWQERLAGTISAGMNMQMQMNQRAMQAEIADLRAALAAATAPDVVDSNSPEFDGIKTAPQQVAASEPERFEAWWLNEEFGGYKESMWAAWQARAALDRPAIHHHHLKSGIVPIELPDAAPAVTVTASPAGVIVNGEPLEVQHQPV